MQFGVKVSEAPASSDEATGSYIKYFPKDGDYRLRYLEEVDDWTRYYEHFHQGKQRSFPCTGDKKSCPGCTSPNERTASASKRFLVNALDPSTGYVDLYKIPASIKGDFDRFTDKDDGTILARDFTVVRYQEDGKTKYSLDREDREERDLTEARTYMKDHQEALKAAYVEVWGGLPGEETDSDDDLPKPVNKEAAREAVRDQVSQKLNLPENPPTEPASEPVEAVQEEETTLSEDALRSMQPDELRALFVRCGLADPGPQYTPDQLTDLLIEALA